MEIYTYILWNIYKMKYYIYKEILHKKERNNAIFSNMNVPRGYHTKWSKSEREKHHMTSFICGILKNHTNELIYETETDSRT